MIYLFVRSSKNTRHAWKTNINTFMILKRVFVTYFHFNFTISRTRSSFRIHNHTSETSTSRWISSLVFTVIRDCPRSRHHRVSSFYINIYIILDPIESPQRSCKLFIHDQRINIIYIYVRYIYLYKRKRWR
jgi:hypothetical protein